MGVWMEGGGGGTNVSRQLKFLAISQLSVKFSALKHAEKKASTASCPSFLFLLCALGSPWANYSAAFPEKVRQCCNAAVWQGHCKKEYIM